MKKEREKMHYSWLTSKTKTIRIETINRKTGKHVVMNGTTEAHLYSREKRASINFTSYLTNIGICCN